METNRQKYSTFIRSYWNYYLNLDMQMMSTCRYVEFDSVNFSTYSIEFLKLYQAVCSEIDVVGKYLASEINPEFKTDDGSNTILKWWFEIQNWYDVCKKKTVSFRQQYNLTPWDSFRVEYVPDKNGRMYPRISQQGEHKVPFWWSAYNKVKHNRTSIDSKTNAQYYTKANLLNLSNAYAALYLLEKGYLSIFNNELISQSTGKSALFECDQPIFSISEDGNLCYTYEYD